ncbi:MAG: hypothetical protein ACFE0I_03750 [Elainellaceae cyanobacterium]
MNSKLTPYEELELLPPNSQYPAVSTILTRKLSHLIGQLLRSLVATDEPRITQIGSTQTGEPRFHAYDPITRQGIRGVSETELRIWLEQRYRRTQGVLNTDPYFWMGLRH